MLVFLVPYLGEIGVLGAERVEADNDGVAGVDLQVLLGDEGRLAQRLLRVLGEGVGGWVGGWVDCLEERLLW